MRFTTAFISMAAAYAFTSSAAPTPSDISTANIIDVVPVPVNRGAPALELDTAGLSGRADSAVTAPKLDVPADRSALDMVAREEDPIKELEDSIYAAAEGGKGGKGDEDEGGEEIKRQLQVNPCTDDSGNEACDMTCGLINEGKGVCKKTKAGKWECHCGA